MTNARRGGQLLVACLEKMGIERCFGVPGESYLEVLDGLVDSAIEFVNCRHESAAGFAASAAGKLTGQPGICFVTRGPGATNASIGVHDAMQNSSPMILFVGQIATSRIDREAFQELDYRRFFSPLAKWVTQIDKVERIPETLSRAFATALSGRPGPVVIALPEDMLAQETQAEPVSLPSLARAAADPALLAAALDKLLAADRPLIIAGGSGWDTAGQDHLQKFVETHQIPVLGGHRRQDVLDNFSPVYVGDTSVGLLPHTADLIRQADVIWAMNIRFGEVTTADWQLKAVPKMDSFLIHSHAGPEELNKIYQADIAFNADPNLLANQLANQLAQPAAGLAKPHAERLDWLAAARTDHAAASVPPPQDSPVDMGFVMGWLQDNLDKDAILTNGAGNFALWPSKYFRYSKGQRLLGPQSGAMGYGIPAALAASLQYPGRQVICFAGDGDMQMSLAELASIRQSGARVLILILNNASYGTIRMHQETHFPARKSATDLINPDFAAVARACGLFGEQVASTDDFPAAFQRLQASETGGVLELAIATEAIAPLKTLSNLGNKGIKGKAR